MGKGKQRARGASAKVGKLDNGLGRDGATDKQPQANSTKSPIFLTQRIRQLDQLTDGTRGSLQQFGGLLCNLPEEGRSVPNYMARLRALTP
jgi:hypothetical protein